MRSRRFVLSLSTRVRSRRRYAGNQMIESILFPHGLVRVGVRVRRSYVRMGLRAAVKHPPPSFLTSSKATMGGSKYLFLWVSFLIMSPGARAEEESELSERACIERKDSLNYPTSQELQW